MWDCMGLGPLHLWGPVRLNSLNTPKSGAYVTECTSANFIESSDSIHGSIEMQLSIVKQLQFSWDKRTLYLVF